MHPAPRLSRPGIRQTHKKIGRHRPTLYAFPEATSHDLPRNKKPLKRGFLKFLAMPNITNLHQLPQAAIVNTFNGLFNVRSLTKIALPVISAPPLAVITIILYLKKGLPPNYTNFNQNHFHS